MEPVSSIWRDGRVPRAVEQRRRNVNGQPWPGGSKFECGRRSDRSDKSSYDRRLAVALDPAMRFEVESSCK
jgi:hypothetical protein